MTKSTFTTSSTVQAPVLSVASATTAPTVSASIPVPVSVTTGPNHQYIPLKPSSLPSATVPSGLTPQMPRQRLHPIAIAPKPASKPITRRASMPAQSVRPRRCSKNSNPIPLSANGGTNDNILIKSQPINLESSAPNKGKNRSVSASTEDIIPTSLEVDNNFSCTKRSGSPTPGVQPAKRKECPTKPKSSKQRYQNVSGKFIHDANSNSLQITNTAKPALKTSSSNQEDALLSSLLSIDENPLLSSLDSNSLLDHSSLTSGPKEMAFKQFSGKTRPGVRALHEVQNIERTHFFSPPSSPAPIFPTSTQLAPEAPSSIFNLDTVESPGAVTKDSDHYISPQISAQPDSFLFDKQSHLIKSEPISFLPESFCNEPIFGLPENSPLNLPITSTGTPPTEENSPAIESSPKTSLVTSQASDSKSKHKKETSKKSTTIKTEKETLPATSLSPDPSLTQSSESALALSPNSSSTSPSSITSPETAKNQFLDIENNPDYIALTSALSILESQRDKARQDIVCLKNLKTDALRNPTDFIRQVRKTGRVYGAPSMQKIVRAPLIQWEKYGIDISDLEQRIRRGIVDTPDHAPFGSIRLFDDLLDQKRTEF